MPPLETDEATAETSGEAKSAIESAYRDALGDRLLVIRPGLIVGPGDPSGRGGYWVARAARSDEPMLVPDILDDTVQAIHVDDLVTFTIDAVERRLTGAFNAVGERTTFGDWLERSRALAGHEGEVVAVSPEWLAEQGVAEWSGPESLPLWIIDPEWSAFLDRSNAAALAAGLRLRPLDQLLREILEWERSQGLDRERGAGLSADRERELLAALRGRARGPSSTTRTPASPASMRPRSGRLREEAVQLLVDREAASDARSDIESPGLAATAPSRAGGAPRASDLSGIADTSGGGCLGSRHPSLLPSEHGHRCASERSALASGR